MTIAARWIVVACAISAPAYAQSPEAESLFREGKALLAKGKIAEACDKLEASDKVDAKAGTELNLGDCREKNKQYASAWATFLKAASTAKKENDTKRATEAKRRAKLLEPKLRYLTIKVPDDRKYDGLEITRDGQVVDEAVWNQRVPVDQGTHKLKATATNRQTWKEEVEIDKSDEETELPTLDEIEAPDEQPVVENKKKRKPKPAPEPETGRRYVGLAITSSIIAVGGFGAGAFFGLKSRSQADDADAKCPNQNCFDREALELNDNARKNTKIANASFIAGGVGVIGAVVFYLVGAPREAKVAVLPSVTSDEVGVSLGGRF
jgi:hypothetical protein